MDRPTQVHEGFRTFPEFDVTIEIIIFRQSKFGLYEVLARDQLSHSELRPIYLRASVIEQRIKPTDMDQFLSSFRTEFDPQHLLSDDELFDSIVRVSIFNYIADRLSLKQNIGASADIYELEYLPAASDREFGPDKRRLEQLICKDPYRYGAPSPYVEIVAEPARVQSVKTKQLSFGDDSSKQSKSASERTSSLGTMYRGITSMFGMSMSTKSEGSQRTGTVPSTGCVSRASVEFTDSMKVAIQRSITDNSESSKARETQDFARQILNRLNELPGISEEHPGAESPEISVPTPNVPTHTPDVVNPEFQHGAVTPDQLKAYFSALNDVEVRARIPYRQHPSLTPPKCVAHLAVKATRSASNSINIELSEKVASPLVVQQVKPTAKPVIPLLNLTNVTNGSNKEPVKRFSFISMFFGGSSRVGVALA